MPVILMAVRVEINVIFQKTFEKFFNNIGASGNKQPMTQDGGGQPFHIQKANRLINGVISELLDRNLFYSRLTFLDSDKEGFDVYDQLHQGRRIGFQEYKLPNITDKYYTRSSKVRHLQQSSDVGRVRAKFSDNMNNLKASLKEQADRLKSRLEAEKAVERSQT